MNRLKIMTMVLSVVVCLTLTFKPDNEVMAQETVDIKIAGARTEDPWYAFSQALANFINKKSEWLRAEAVTTSGLTANIELIKAKPDEYIGLAPTSTTLHARPGHEWGEAREPYTGARFISNITTMTQLLVTYEEDMNTPEDLKGKKIDVGRKGAGNTPDHLAILESMGVESEVDLVYTGFGGGAKRLRDGHADASFLIINHTYPHKFGKGSLIERMETKKPVHYMGFDRDMLLELRDSEHGTVPVHIPKGSFGENQPEEDLWGFNDPVYLMADETMDAKIVGEVTRVIFETPAEEWAEWHPQGEHMTTEVKTATPVPDVVPAHQGTKEFYSKEGLEMTDLADLLK